MTQKTVSALVLIVVLVLVPLTACNRSAAPDLLEAEDELMQQAASEVEEPTQAPTYTPTVEPTEEATEVPTATPTAVPTEEITPEPTEEATEAPTEEATETPTEEVVDVTVEPTGDGTQHVVKAGENLFRIALRYNTTVEALAQANGITNPALIYAGQVLTIPGGQFQPQPQPGTGERVHVVQPGENLFRIALKYNYDYYYLARYNNIDNPALVYVGQKILIPAP
ncbi:MAG: LysM peptidoglycan-binding domain-containing protein [Anaerolineae bacterium]